MPNTAPALMSVLLSIHDAAAALGVSRRTLWSMTAPRGSIPCVRIGSRVLYRPESLRDWAQAQEAVPHE